ncbi:MAG: hypothetical protein ACK5SX_04255 [Sandaracinobacter sp.]
MEAARKPSKTPPAPARPVRRPAPSPATRVAALQSQIGATAVAGLLNRQTGSAANGQAAAAPGRPFATGAAPALAVQPPGTAGPGRHAAPASHQASAGDDHASAGKGHDGTPRHAKPNAKAHGRAESGDGEKAPAGADKEAEEANVAGKAGGAGAVKLHMPEPPSAPSKATQARLAGVKARAGGTAAAQGSLPSAAEQVGDVQKAVTPPTAEQLAKARAELIATVNAAPSPEIVELAAKIRKAIHDRRPPDEDALVEAKPEQAANEAGNTLNASVQSETKKVEDNYGAMNQPAQAAPAPPGAPLPPPPGAAPTPALNAKAGVPDAVPAQNVSLDKDAAATRKQADEAGMNKPAAMEVKSGPIAEAREAQGELDQAAKEDPAQVLAKQKEALGKADADMGALQMQALAALTSARTGTVTKATGQQRGMVGSEEQQRATAGAEAKTIFDDAQAQVRALLKPLVPNAMAKWDAAKDTLTTKFKADLAIVKKRVDERHAGVTGWFRGLKDAVVGLPDWATDAYDAAEINFSEGVIHELLHISTEVNSVIKACEGIIEAARNKIHGIFEALPASLKTWAAQEQAKLNGQLDKLGKEVTDARDGFNKDLGDRAREAVDEVRAEIAELRKKAGGLVGRIVDAVKRFVDDPVKFIIEGLLELLGISPPAFWAVVAKIKKVVKDIVDDPMGFANNLMKGIGQGFSQFFGNFAEHMIRGFLSWLLGDLKDVQVPKDISVKSIITFFLQLMGITWPNIRKILAKRIGEKNVALIEKVYSLISMLMEQGPQGIYEMVKEKLDPQAIVDQVVQMAVEYMVTAIAKQVAVRLALLFNPAGAILQAIEAIYRVLKWVFENAARIFTLIETIVNGLADIIAGNVGGFANAVEKGLGMLIPPVLGFIADYFSLGDLPKKVATMIKGMREWILAKIEAGFDWLIAKGKALLAALGIGGKDKDKDKDKKGDPGALPIGEEIEFEADGEGHRLWFVVQGAQATLMVASKQEPVSDFLKYASRYGSAPIKAKVAKVTPLLQTADKDADTMAKLAVHVPEKGETDSQKDMTKQQKKLTDEERLIADLLREIFEAMQPIKRYLGRNVSEIEPHRTPLGYDLRKDQGTFAYGGTYNYTLIQRAAGFGSADESAFPRVHVDRDGTIVKDAGISPADWDIIDAYRAAIAPYKDKLDDDGAPVFKGGPDGPPNSLEAGANRDLSFNRGIRKQMEAIVDAINKGRDITGVEVKVGDRRIDYTMMIKQRGRDVEAMVEYKHWTGKLSTTRAIELAGKLRAQLRGQISGGAGDYKVLYVEWPEFDKIEPKSHFVAALVAATEFGASKGVKVIPMGFSYA